MNNDEDELRVRLLMAETRIVQLQQRLDGLDGQKTKRLKPSDNKRTRVFKASGGKCFYCNVTIGEEAFTVDHVWPRCRGGGNDIHNLVAACFPCNKAKGDSLPTEGEIIAAEELYGKFRGKQSPQPQIQNPPRKKKKDFARGEIKDRGLRFLFEQATVRGRIVKRGTRGRNWHYGSSQ